MKVKISRRATFNAAHRLHNKNWSEEKNKLFFGKCNNPHYHGHNYTLIVSVLGDINEDSGYVIDISYLKKIIEDKIIDYLDHKNLNLEVVEFQELNPTLENIIKVIYDKLRKELSNEFTLSIILYETENNFAEINETV
ncbi:6-pyruvoyl trahydropterin synthase family protein [Chryseobacterium sp. JV558]|uniref:6-pyruvoyl trahydropterin synthase family protein n=1 Tax=Chryseobacterium sp. JV558 TaxID=2663236 RepID=UPI00299D087A|nr:6-carboxytetrahydropterin synthase [Chryseobacterium sp. JV558]MDW9383014.1 6-carboxytetrahydropterin synthase [Chryseobacterium sp. JV558]